MHRVNYVTISLGSCNLSLPLFGGSKYHEPKMALHDLCAWSFEDGCLCSILHGPLQLQIWTAFLLPARLFPTAAGQSATQLSHTTSSQLSEPTQGSSSTCILLFPFPARFSALHCSPHLHKRAVVALTPQTPPSPLLCGCSQLVRLGRRYACPRRQTFRTCP